MKRIYSEKLLENSIRDFPKEFLHEDLELFLQQPTIAEFRPDLVFKDTDNKYVIVEVQLNALDRNHFYRILEYRDLFAEKYDCEPPRVILFANVIPKRFLSLAKVHNVKCIALSKKEFLKKIKELKPALKVVNSLESKSKTKKAFTMNSLLRKLNSSVDKDDKYKCDYDATVVIMPCGFPHDRYQNVYEYGYKYRMLPLPEVEKKHLFINSEDTWDIQPEGTLKFSDLPVEIIIENAALTSFDKETFRRLEAWLDLIDPYDYTYVLQLNRSFNPWFLNEDIYDYRRYKEGRIKKFNAVEFQYGSNVELIREDLEKLSNISFIFGKFPDFYKVKFCDPINISYGPGPLKVTHWLTSKLKTDEEQRELFKFVEETEKDWLSVRFTGVDMYAYFTLKRLFDKINYNSLDKRSSIFKGIGLTPPLLLKNASEKRLKISAKYLKHLRKEKE